MNANLYVLFQNSFARNWDGHAFVDAHGNGLSFRALDDLSARFATVLGTRGVIAGDRVVVQVEKSVGAVALYLACLRVGAIFVPLNTGYTPAEVAYFVTDAEPRLIVASCALKCGDIMTEILGEDARSPFWSEAVAAPPTAEIAVRGPDDIAAILYTSGTTGRSKGAMLSHDNLAANAKTLHHLWGFMPDDVLLHALPIFHVHGLFVALHTLFLNASTTIFLPKFDAEQIASLLPKATVLMGVPTFYTRLLDLADFGKAQAANMRLFISGSAPLLAETHDEFAARTGHFILERYGMTEAGMITSNPLNGPRVAGTVGMPLPDVELRIVPEGGAGTIEIRGPNVFKGYWRNPEKTAEEFRDGGWFITGDIGVQDADGRVSIVGRAKDLIIAGGYNIYPKEIEDVLNAIPGVTESAVIGVPHPDLGEAVFAVIVGAASEQDIQAVLAQGLARFKHPRGYAFVDQLPRNAMGKVQKAELRKTYAERFA